MRDYSCSVTSCKMTKITQDTDQDKSYAYFMRRIAVNVLFYICNLSYKSVFCVKQAILTKNKQIGAVGYLVQV